MIPISFKKKEFYLEEYLFSKRDRSAFVKDLLEEKMKEDIKNGVYTPKNNKK
ncbi:MAG: hypothetical protein RSC24_06850 [Clostridium sp.]